MELNSDFCNICNHRLTAVCNDSAAVMEQCLFGTTSIYPMTSIGSYMMRTVRYMIELQETFDKKDGMEAEAEDLGAIVKVCLGSA